MVVSLGCSRRCPDGLTRDEAPLILDTLSAVPIWAGSPLLRPWHMRWRATDAEVAAAMRGDDVVARAQFNATRAITIDAPPGTVWPWIAQLGYRRGGFYTYDLVDNAGEPSADRVMEEYQHIGVGDLIPMFHESHGLAVGDVQPHPDGVRRLRDGTSGAQGHQGKGRARQEGQSFAKAAAL